MIEFGPALSQRQFFRFTGPPEHWLTAFKYMTWGLEEHHRARWEKIKTGDVFFIHSTGANNSVFKNAQSGIIGIGVVGFDFSVKDNYLWHYEIKNNTNKWPLLVPLTEVYLFCDLPDPDTWESPEPSNDEKTFQLINQLTENRVPISQIHGFPQMGSFSSVSEEVAQQILSLNRPLYLLSGHSKRGITFREKKSNLVEVHNVDETLRHAASLRFLEEIKQRIIKRPFSLARRDNDILARAEGAHYSILDSLIQIFRKKGYSTLSNEFVDLFAHDGKRSFLFEVKSTENRNFRSQARKGIVQLYEYDYFEVNKFKEENQISFQDQYRILVPSKVPCDTKYVNFINSLDLGIGVVEENCLKSVGKDFGFTRI